MDNACVVIRPVAAWVTGHADPARVKPFAHRWAGTRTTDLDVLEYRRERLIDLVQRVGDVSLGARLTVATADWRQRDWDSAWVLGHWHSRWARNGFITLLPALEALDPADALALVFRFLDDAMRQAG